MAFTITTITITQTIDPQRVSDLLCTALEGGSNYWYNITGYTEPETLAFRTDPEHIFRHLDYPMNEGGSITIADLEDADTVFKHSEITLEVLREGLQIMADKYPKHFGDFMAENDDACTGDVFLQCCCFGEVIYG